MIGEAVFRDPPPETGAPMARKPHKDIAADDAGYNAYMREQVACRLNQTYRTFRRVDDHNEWVDLPNMSPEEKILR